MHFFYQTLKVKTTGYTLHSLYRNKYCAICCTKLCKLMFFYLNLLYFDYFHQDIVIRPQRLCWSVNFDKLHLTYALCRWPMMQFTWLRCKCLPETCITCWMGRMVVCPLLRLKWPINACSAQLWSRLSSVITLPSLYCKLWTTSCLSQAEVSSAL